MPATDEGGRGGGADPQPGTVGAGTFPGRPALLSCPGVGQVGPAPDTDPRGFAGGLRPSSVPVPAATGTGPPGLRLLSGRRAASRLGLWIRPHEWSETA